MGVCNLIGKLEDFTQSKNYAKQMAPAFLGRHDSHKDACFE